MSRVMNKLGEWIEALFETHKLVRRSLVMWAIYEIHRIITHLISVITEVTTPVASVAGAIIGILSTVLVFYIRSRELDKNGSNRTTV
jgi:hypothetical protein